MWRIVFQERSFSKRSTGLRTVSFSARIGMRILFLPRVPGLILRIPWMLMIFMAGPRKLFHLPKKVSNFSFCTYFSKNFEREKFCRVKQCNILPLNWNQEPYRKSLAVSQSIHVTAIFLNLPFLWSFSRKKLQIFIQSNERNILLIITRTKLIILLVLYSYKNK